MIYVDGEEYGFTFHYVSIKSMCNYMLSKSMTNLHSTMYLLNLVKAMTVFLNGSFTFHYVSIKSNFEIGNIFDTIIYIPLCIY